MQSATILPQNANVNEAIKICQTQTHEVEKDSTLNSEEKAWLLQMLQEQSNCLEALNLLDEKCVLSADYKLKIVYREFLGKVSDLQKLIDLRLRVWAFAAYQDAQDALSDFNEQKAVMIELIDKFTMLKQSQERLNQLLLSKTNTGKKSELISKIRLTATCTSEMCKGFEARYSELKTFVNRDLFSEGLILAEEVFALYNMRSQSKINILNHVGIHKPRPKAKAETQPLKRTISC